MKKKRILNLFGWLLCLLISAGLPGRYASASAETICAVGVAGYDFSEAEEILETVLKEHRKKLRKAIDSAMLKDEFNIITNNTIEKAISYAKDQKGSSSWAGMCAMFVNDCYAYGAGVTLEREPTARELGDKLITCKDDDPPRGAFVFWYKASDPYGQPGHVGISLGDGYVIHAFSSIKITTIDYVTGRGYKYRGWGAPVEGRFLETDSDVISGYKNDLIAMYGDRLLEWNQ